jgi:hypothetical protein
MVKRGTPVPAGGPRQSLETGIARAETLGQDGCQRTWKPGPDGAEGPTGAQESALSLFPSGTPNPGKTARARGGGPRDMGEEAGRPGAGTQHATQPPAGTAAGGRANTVGAYTIPPHGASVDNNNTRLDGGPDNGESSDVSQKHDMTPGTASAVFPRLGYAMAVRKNITRQPGPATSKSE